MDFREILLKNCRRYPKLRGRDLIKLLYQFSFGCEHLVADEKTVLARIISEAESIKSGTPSEVEELGDYCRVGLSYLDFGLSAETLARIFCLSNYVSAANPYFVRMRVYPDPGKDITVFRDKAVLIERCAGYRSAIEENNPWNKVYAAANVGNYESEREDSLITLVSRIPKGAQPAPYLFRIDGITYREWRKNSISYFDEYRGSVKGIVIFTPNVSECGAGVQLILPYILSNLNDGMITGTLRFRDPNVMFAILSMVYETV